MLTEKPGLSAYKTKESLIDVIRSKRGQNNAGTASVSSDVPGPIGILRGAIQPDQSSDRGYESQGGATTHDVYGGNGSSTRGEGGKRGFVGQFRRFNRVSSGDSSGSNKYQRSATTERAAKFSIRDIAGRYKDALTGKQGTTKTKKKVVEGRKLTDAEAIRLRPKMIEYILWQSEHLDQFIIATTVGHDGTIEIWGDLDDAEAEILVDYLIARGKVSVRTANTVRYVSSFIDKIKLGLILGPRVYKTIRIYMERGLSLR